MCRTIAGRAPPSRPPTSTAQCEQAARDETNHMTSRTPPVTSARKSLGCGSFGYDSFDHLESTAVRPETASIIDISSRAPSADTFDRRWTRGVPAHIWPHRFRLAVVDAKAIAGEAFLLLVDDIRQVGGGHRGAGMGTNSAPGGNIRPSTPRLGRVLRASRDFSIRGRLDQRHLRSADRGPGPGRQAFAAAANTSEHVDKPRGAAMNSASWVDLLAPRFGLCAQSISASLARSASGSGY